MTDSEGLVLRGEKRWRQEQESSVLVRLLPVDEAPHDESDLLSCLGPEPTESARRVSEKRRISNDGDLTHEVFESDRCLDFPITFRYPPFVLPQSFVRHLLSW
jgi:hypothetical protein